jgi:hypothetical protein
VKPGRKRADQSAPNVTPAQIEELRTNFAGALGEPLFHPGKVSVCPDCGGRMVTTNNLAETVAAPGMVFVVVRLPGALCQDCGAKKLDGSAVGMLESSLPRELLADYETAVTHSSSKTLGTYFKMDLARVLRLTGGERLFWKVVDRDRAVVSVERNYPASKGRMRKRPIEA